MEDKGKKGQNSNELSEKDLLGFYDSIFADFCEHDLDIINTYFNNLKIVNELWRVLKRKERKHLIKSAKITFVIQALQRAGENSKSASEYIKATPDYQSYKAKISEK